MIDSSAASQNDNRVILLDAANFLAWGDIWLRKRGWSSGTAGEVKVFFTIVPRREAQSVVELIKRFNPKAFYSIEEVGFVEKGIFPAKRCGDFFSLSKLFKPFRKDK